MVTEALVGAARWRSASCLLLIRNVHQLAQSVSQ